MWVLEARKNAETVWYPVVWETEKDASNVIDYDIHDEITKDTSSVINANNDTTTGMANVIPWINAPKLIASTSIIWDLWWWGWWWGSAWCHLYHDVFFYITTATTPLEYDVKNFTISSEVWDLQFTQWDNWIVIPKTATYVLQAEWAKWISICRYDTILMQDDEVLHTFNWTNSSSDPTNETLFLPLTKGKNLWIKMIAYYSWSWTLTVTSRYINIDIQSIT